MAKRCFYSFHYVPDCHRASQVRQMGVIEGNRPVSDNDWESITSGGDSAIKKWIAEQMVGKSCVVVLVGANTARRKWINYEIVYGWNQGKGVVGIRIHGLKNLAGETASYGDNPFDYIDYGDSGQKLSSVVKCYNPGGSSSKEKYSWIKENLVAAVDEAVRIRTNV